MDKTGGKISQINTTLWHFHNEVFDFFWKHLFTKEVKAKRWQIQLNMYSTNTTFGTSGQIQPPPSSPMLSEVIMLTSCLKVPLR